MIRTGQANLDMFMNIHYTTSMTAFSSFFDRLDKTLFKSGNGH